jgi:dolichol-phosphate mannosyltransferase
MNDKFLLSVVVPVFNEEGNIEILLKTLLSVVQSYDYELIFVDDGSTDDTVDTLKTYTHDNKHLKLVTFSRNFGHQMALTAGYEEARGDCVVTIDADLQDPPELIDEMIVKWKEGYKIVYAKRSSRDESFFKKTTATFFYRLVNLLSDTPIPQNVGDFRLLDREVVDLLKKLPEKSRFLRGLVAWGGYPSTFVSFTRKKRSVGKTHYTLSKMVNFALDGIISFSTKPLKIATYVGFFASVLGLLGIVYAITLRFFLPHQYWVTGWTALFVAVMFFGGIQLITIGIIGEYIAKIYTEVQGRPGFVIKERVNV